MVKVLVDRDRELVGGVGWVVEAESDQVVVQEGIAYVPTVEQSGPTRWVSPVMGSSAPNVVHKCRENRGERR